MWIIYRPTLPLYEFWTGQGITTSAQRAWKYQTKEAAEKAAESLGREWLVCRGLSSM